jgi:hypothetical protein
MDPILDEMRRLKSPSDIRDSRFRDWTDYLCALVAKKDDEIASLKARLDEKRGPGRPRKDEAAHE